MIIKIQLGLRDPIHTFSRAAKFLTIQLQDGIPTIWLEHDSAQPQARYQILQLMTGEPSPPLTANYIGTLQIKGFVIHYYYLETELTQGF